MVPRNTNNERVKLKLNIMPGVHVFGEVQIFPKTPCLALSTLPIRKNRDRQNARSPVPQTKALDGTCKTGPGHDQRPQHSREYQCNRYQVADNRYQVDTTDEYKQQQQTVPGITGDHSK